MKQHDTHPTRLTRRGEVLRTTAVLAGLAAVAVTAGGIEQHHENAVKHEKRVAALREVDGTLDHVFMLKAGATFRSTPDTLNASDDVGIDNRLGSVPKGKNWIVRLPGSSSEHPGWISFVEPDVKPESIHSIDDRANATVWVNLEALTEQGYAQDTPYQGTGKGGDMYKTAVLPDGQFALEGRPASNMSVSVALEADQSKPNAIDFMFQGYEPAQTK